MRDYKEWRKRKVGEILAENFPKLVKDANSWVQEIQHIEKNK